MDPISEAANAASTAVGLDRRYGRDRRLAWVIRGLPASAYVVPLAGRRTLGAAALAELEGLLREVAALDQECLGLSAMEAMLRVGPDPRVAALRERIWRWCEAYAAARLSRPNPRDEGDPARRYLRLATEDLLRWLEGLTAREGLQMLVLHGLKGYICWLFRRATIARWSSDDPHPVAPPTPIHRSIFDEMEVCFRWRRERVLDAHLRLLLARGAVRSPIDPDVARRRLATLAAEIREARPLVLRGYKPARCVIQLGRGLTATWEWSVFYLGTVSIHDEAGQLRKLECSTIAIGWDGRACGYESPWIDVDTLDLDEGQGLAANLVILEAVHARLMDLFARIDTWAIQQRVRVELAVAEPEPAPTPVATPAEEPELAAQERGRLPSLRLKRLAPVLERLGCTLRPGKGSEVVVRRGERGNTLGAHLANPQISSIRLHHLLNRLGISLPEFLTALDPS